MTTDNAVEDDLEGMTWMRFKKSAPWHLTLNIGICYYRTSCGKSFLHPPNAVSPDVPEDAESCCFHCKLFWDKLKTPAKNGAQTARVEATPE